MTFDFLFENRRMKIIREMSSCIYISSIISACLFIKFLTYKRCITGKVKCFKNYCRIDKSPQNMPFLSMSFLYWFWHYGIMFSSMKWRLNWPPNDVVFCAITIFPKNWNKKCRGFGIWQILSRISNTILSPRWCRKTNFTKTWVNWRERESMKTAISG